MYSYIKGKVTDQSSNYVVLECLGIGYEIFVSNPFLFKLNEDYKIYIYENIREDEHSLFGFMSSEEKDLFLKIIGVKGIGPRMALPMFATGSLDEISSAIENEDIEYLKKFPKIGDKVARQIILDLRSKISKNSVNINAYGELIEVLKGLGYKEKEFKPILNKVNGNLNIEEQIKEALKFLLK